MAGCIPDWVKLFIPPLTTVFVGGFLIQRFFVRRANQAAFVDHIVDELGELRSDALEYWAQALTPDTRDTVKQLEARIKGRVHSLVSDLNFFRNSRKQIHQRVWRWMRDKWFTRLQHPTTNDEGPSYVVAMLNVYEACTNGDFETDGHQASPEKYFPICSAISSVKSELLRIKL